MLGADIRTEIIFIHCWYKHKLKKNFWKVNGSICQDNNIHKLQPINPIPESVPM